MYTSGTNRISGFFTFFGLARLFLKIFGPKSICVFLVSCQYYIFFVFRKILKTDAATRRSKLVKNHFFLFLMELTKWSLKNHLRDEQILNLLKFCKSDSKWRSYSNLKFSWRKRVKFSVINTVRNYEFRCLYNYDPSHNFLLFGMLFLVYCSDN